MKVTIDIDADLYRSIKFEAVRSDQTVRKIIDEALDTWLGASDTRGDVASAEAALVEHRRVGGATAQAYFGAAEYFPVVSSNVSLKLPFSEAVRVGDILYLSGALGIDGTGHLVTGGIEAETRQALANIEAILERRGSSLDRVVKATVMLADIGEWAAMNTVYLEHFPEHLPARSAFGTSGLALGARVELEVIATVG